MGDNPGHEFRGNQYTGGGGSASVLKDEQSKTGGVKVRLYGSQQAQTAAGTPWGPQHGSVIFKTHDVALAHAAAKTYAEKGGKAFAEKWKAAKAESKAMGPHAKAVRAEHAKWEKDKAAGKFSRSRDAETYKNPLGIVSGHEHTGLSDFHKGKK